MRTPPWLLSLGFVTAALSACSGVGDMTTDALSDAAVGFDAGLALDGGRPDSGSADAAMGFDAGLTTDGGRPDAATATDAGGQRPDASGGFDAGTPDRGDGGVPPYIASLAPFQVRALSASFSPSNGTTSLASVTPTGGAFGDWLNQDPGVEDVAGVINDWCGGAKPLSGTKMYVHGGGHNGSANNGLYVFDYAGDNRPTGWSLPSISPLSAVVAGAKQYSDGQPTSSHTADTTCLMNGLLYRLTSIPYNPSGGFSNDSWKYDPATNEWTRLADSPTSSCYVYPNEATNQILCIDRWASDFGYYFYDATTNTFSDVKYVAEQWPSNFTVAYKPLTATTGVALMAGGGKSYTSVVDWASQTITQVARTLGGVAQTEGPGAFYDAERDRFWMFGGASAPYLVDEIDPATWAVTSHSLSGDAYGFNADYNGTFSRFVFMPQYRALGFVPTATGPAYVVRLPQ